MWNISPQTGGEKHRSTGREKKQEKKPRLSDVFEESMYGESHEVKCLTEDELGTKKKKKKREKLVKKHNLTYNIH